MPFHLLAYTGSLGVNAVNTDLTAAVDGEFTQRSGHYTFSDKLQLLAAIHLAVSATRSHFFVPLWNQLTTWNIWPVNRSTNVPSNPQLDYYIAQGIEQPLLPINEEFQVRASNNLGAATEQTTVFLWVGTPDWTQNLPRGIPMDQMYDSASGPFEIRANFTTVALTANVWSGLGALTLEQGLRSGTYAVVGAQLQGAAIQAFRLVFPRAPIIGNRKLRPGTLASQAIGDVPIDYTPYQQYLWGEWGRFNTFELPQIEFFANTGGAIAVEMRLWLVWLSKDMNVRYAMSA